jgi:hypothetical protein
VCRVQVCDDTCKERFLDGESYVCPISGYSSNRLVTEWEEAGAAAARGDDAAAEDGAEMGGGSPPLPFAYLHAVRGVHLHLMF